MQSTFRYAVQAGNAGDAYAGVGTLTFTDADGNAGVSRILDITVWDNAALVTMSYDGIIFGDDYEVDPDDPPVQLPHAVRAFQIMNKTAGNVARYQVAAFW